MHVCSPFVPSQFFFSRQGRLCPSTLRVGVSFDFKEDNADPKKVLFLRTCQNLYLERQVHLLVFFFFVVAPLFPFGKLYIWSLFFVSTRWMLLEEERSHPYIRGPKTNTSTRQRTSRSLWWVTPVCISNKKNKKNKKIKTKRKAKPDARNNAL